MKKSNTIGVVVLAASILFSFPLGCNRSFHRLRENQVMGYYYYDSTGYAIYEGIDNRVAAARNLVTVAERYVKENPGLDPYIDEVEYRAKLCENCYFQDVKDVGQLVSWNELLQSATEALVKELETVELSEKDAKYPRQLLADLDSEQDKIERSSFNDKVIEYNEKLTHFPARVLAPISGVKPIQPFGQGSRSDRIEIKTVEKN